MSREYAIRLARPADADAFHKVETDAATLLREVPELAGIPIPPPGTAAHYRALIAKGDCLTATIGDMVVGFAAARQVRRELHLEGLSVARAAQRQGIGSTLLRALFIDARNRGLCAITLDTFQDVAFNAPFYARHGFIEVENFESHPHLAKSLDDGEAAGLPREKRVAMIAFLT